MNWLARFGSYTCAVVGATVYASGIVVWMETVPHVLLVMRCGSISEPRLIMAILGFLAIVGLLGAGLLLFAQVLSHAGWIWQSAVTVGITLIALGALVLVVPIVLII